jgi:hypothetical protein
VREVGGERNVSRKLWGSSLERWRWGACGREHVPVSGLSLGVQRESERDVGVLTLVVVALYSRIVPKVIGVDDTPDTHGPRRVRIRSQNGSSVILGRDTTFCSSELAGAEVRDGAHPFDNLGGLESIFLLAIVVYVDAVVLEVAKNVVEKLVAGSGSVEDLLEPSNAGLGTCSQDHSQRF